MKPKPTCAKWLIMMEYDEQCKLDPTMPLNNPCTRYNLHLATLVIITLCSVMMSQSGDITTMNLESCAKEGGIKGKRLGLGEKRHTMSQKYENLAYKSELYRYHI
jgi:hypothetical protein